MVKEAVLLVLEPMPIPEPVTLILRVPVEVLPDVVIFNVEEPPQLIEPEVKEVVVSSRFEGVSPVTGPGKPFKQLALTS